MHESKVKAGLEVWRDAVRLRDALAAGSPEWQEADEQVRSASKVFHAELAQASVRYAEEEFQGRNPWSTGFERRAASAVNGSPDDLRARSAPR
jgi:hypothetical protein